MDLEQGRHLDYWKVAKLLLLSDSCLKGTFVKDITVVCESELHKLRKAESSMRTGLNIFVLIGLITAKITQLN